MGARMTLVRALCANRYASGRNHVRLLYPRRMTRGPPLMESELSEGMVAPFRARRRRIFAAAFTEKPSRVVRLPARSRRVIAEIGAQPRSASISNPTTPLTGRILGKCTLTDMTYELVLAALADPTRRSILESLRDAPRTVGELAAHRPVSRPAVSQHLRVLEKALLVRAEARGNRRIYSVRRDGLDELRGYLDSFWSDILNAYSAEIERRNGPVRTRRK
jgi:DNA-binding transcriptional ArsR family regulator